LALGFARFCFKIALKLGLLGKLYLASSQPAVIIVGTLVGGLAMLRTITLGSCVSVQGLQVGQLPYGKIIVRVDDKNFVGKPIMPTRKS
jgi:hypothetical protein